MFDDLFTAMGRLEKLGKRDEASIEEACLGLESEDSLQIIIKALINCSATEITEAIEDFGFKQLR